jgi:hypothetical protein
MYQKCRQLNHNSSYAQPTYHYTDQAILSQDNIELKYQVDAHHYDFIRLGALEYDAG